MNGLSDIFVNFEISAFSYVPHRDLSATSHLIVAEISVHKGANCPYKYIIQKYFKSLFLKSRKMSLNPFMHPFNWCPYSDGSKGALGAPREQIFMV